MSFHAHFRICVSISDSYLDNEQIFVSQRKLHFSCFVMVLTPLSTIFQLYLGGQFY
jgi:hypothetical protein